MLHIPPDIRDEWSDIFWDCLSAFLAKPSVPTFADVFLCSKCLLAIVRHGGKQRAEAVSRTVRARITMWRAGKILEIWERLGTHAKQRDEEKQLQREAQRVARMVKACYRELLHNWGPGVWLLVRPRQRQQLKNFSRLDSFRSRVLTMPLHHRSKSSQLPSKR